MYKEMKRLIQVMEMIEMDKRELLQCDYDDYDEIAQNLLDLFVRSNDLKDSVVKTLTRMKHERRKSERGND